MTKSTRVFLIFLILMNLSFQWPVDSPRITSTFGESRGDHFHDGIDLISNNFNIKPVEKGKLLYFWNKAVFPFERTTGSGNYMLLDHGTYRSVYIHMDNTLKFNDSYNIDSYIGKFANSGRSYGNHVHLGLFEADTWSSINALKMSEKVEDELPPVIQYFALHIGSNYIILNNNSKIRLTKHYPMLVQIYDEIIKGDRHGIYKLMAKFNGKEVLNINFEKINYESGKISLKNKEFNQIYDGKDYYKIDGIEYIEGINKLEVYAYDFAGNLSYQELTIDVNLDM